MKTHSTDLVSLFAALFFGLIAFVGFSGQIGIQIDDARWVWPATLMVLGVIVLASTGLRSTRSHDELDAPQETTDAPRDDR